MILVKSGETTDPAYFGLCSCHCEGGSPPYTGYYIADEAGFDVGGCGCGCRPSLVEIAVFWAARQP